MLDGNAIMQQALYGGANPNWTVIPARRSHFVQNIVAGIVGAILFMGAIVYLLFNQDFVVGLLGAVDIPGSFQFWRITDYVVGGLAIVGCIAFAINTAREMDTLAQQMLILMPEGFVMQRGASAKTLSAIAYAAIGKPRITVNRGTVYLIMPRVQGTNAMRLELDNRFGPAKKIAQRIIDAQAVYAAATTRQ